MYLQWADFTNDDAHVYHLKHSFANRITETLEFDRNSLAIPREIVG
jgi:hypothetical protein